MKARGMAMDAMNKAQVAELYNLYHLARTALAGQVASKYDRKIWATKEFLKMHPEFGSKEVYLTFERADAGLI
jgi:hypothetical protein